jgi:hypothetical protein
MMFGHDWQRAEAIVVARDKLNRSTGGDGLSNDYKYVVDVLPALGLPFRTTVKAPLPAVNFLPPCIGDTVSILFDPKSHKAKFDSDDDRTNAKAHRAARQTSFDAAATADVASSAAHKPQGGTASPPDLAAIIGGSLAGGLAFEAIRIAALKAMAEGNVVNLAGGAGPSNDPAVRLANLESLRSKGLMTEEEHAAARKHILDTI